MQGAVADADAVLRLGVHKAIPKVSPELVDRIPAKNFRYVKPLRSNWGL